MTGWRWGLVTVAVVPWWVAWATLDRSSEKPQAQSSTKGKVEPKGVVKPVQKWTDRLDFNRDVRPLLAEHCWPCHGTDKAALAKTRNLRLDSFAGATQDRGGYRALVPGSPSKSMIWARISTQESAIKMPPEHPGIKPLSTDGKGILHRWILEGGEYRDHWAFVAPKRVAAPSSRLSTWNRSEIDRWVFSRLDRSSLAPEPEADRGTLIRRVSLTLTGLPPTPEELERFLKDAEPQAYERLVDRLLESPRYGEHQARYWMDEVRYADTHGLHIDNERAVYPYRDWVVRALNEDLPFDDFTVWQLAGDLLPSPTLDQRIATGYVRMNPTTNEGGVIEAEFLAKNTMDRIDTTATVWLGLSAGCAKCHDHKYDPISQREYYSMYAYFNSTADPVLDGNSRVHAPVIKAPSAAESNELSRLDKALSEIRETVSIEAAISFLKDRTQAIPMSLKWEIVGPFGASNAESALAQTLPEKPLWRSSDFRQETVREAIVGRPFGSVFLRTKWDQQESGKLSLRLGSDDGIRVWLDDRLVHEKHALRAVKADEDVVELEIPKGERELRIQVVNLGGNDGVFVGFGDGASRQIQSILPILAKSDRSPEEEKRVRSVYLEFGPEDETSRSYRELLAKHRALDASIPVTMVAEELPQPRPTRLLRRGEYNLPGDFVRRGVPAVLGQVPSSLPNNRLGFARWLVSGRNPLVARVFVNKVWQQHFGTGIVKSSEDFGNRGDWPSHPELLDSLAVRFTENHWRIKDLHRWIVTSQAFRQRAVVSAKKLKADPENRLISRGPRFRLDAEVLRDSALAVSGLLVERPFGKGDKPYQPSGLWEAIAYPISDTARYVQDKGDALYRRSLYLFWKRTSPPATMTLFDAPSREACQVRRSRTNTPLQALATMNDPQFFEAARVLAQRILASQKSDADRMDRAFRLALLRSPTSQETELLVADLVRYRARYQRDVASARSLLAVGESPVAPDLEASELAAWTLVCNTLMNTDEFLTQH